MTTPAFAVNWWQVGWIVANNVIDRVVNLDGQSSNDQYSTYMVSPSIVFNNGTNGGEFYMRPQVSSRVTSFEMHAHRANPVDFGANIVLALSTTSGNGRSLPTIIDVPNTNLIDYLANDGTTFRYNANPDQPRTTKAPTLDIKQLNNQFYDEKSGISVDYLRDYNTGDDIIFEDIIDKIQFNPNENNTSLFFLLDNEYIEWKFNGNITNKYKKEDRINLHFKVITVKQCKGITFESAVHISHSTCPTRIMYAYFSKATLENKQFPLDSKRRSEQSIHILNENKRCRLSCFSSYSFHLLQTAVTPT